MSENNNGMSNFGFFLAGIGMGAIIALLFAPQSGKETRDMLQEKANQGRDLLGARAKDFRGQAEDYVGKAKDLVTRQKEQLSAALEAGKQAYQEERGKH